MNRPPPIPRPCALLCVLGMLTSVGCANHVRYLDVERQDSQSEVRSVRWIVDGEEGLLSSPSVKLGFVQIETVEERTVHETLKMEERTPYQGTRELYEVPVGVAALPVSLTLSTLRFVLLGFIPGEFVTAVTVWGFTAMNPFMNLESAKRVEQRQLAIVASGDQVEEVEVRSPAAEETVEARLDGGRPVQLKTDSEGALRLHLLDVVDLDDPSRPRKLRVRLGKPGSQEGVERELMIERALGARLASARDHLRGIQDPGSDVDAYSRHVHALDKLGFYEYSLRLEEEVTLRLAQDPTRAEAFRRSLETLYSVPAADAAVH